MSESSKTLRGHILAGGQWLCGSIQYSSVIESIDGKPVSEEEVRGGNQPIILPGFIDCHVHGGGGGDFMEGYDAAQTIIKTQVKFGTTALLATTMTAPFEDIDNAVNAISRLYTEQKKPQKSGSRVLGMHLEGPYISAQRLGAQPNFVCPGDIEQVLKWHFKIPIRTMTIAPEIGGHLDFIAGLKKHNINVQIGHTSGTYEDGVAAIKAGARSFTHLYNAMSPLHHRTPGMVGAALAHAEHAEIILDLLHVHPGAFYAANRAIPNLYCVTDSTSATGMEDGDYRLGRQIVHKCLGGVRLDDGTLAGSVLTLDTALRNLVSLGLPLAEASKYVSERPAKYLGETHRGDLKYHYFADIVVLNQALMVERVFVEGEEIDLKS